MTAIRTTLDAKDKVPLHQHVPLDTPLSLTIEPSGICNLKCSFCLFSLSQTGTGFVDHKAQLMTEEIYQRIVTDLRRFPKHVKSVTFARLGEPLLNKALPWMVEKLKSESLCEKALVISNGIPLTPQMSRDLANAGLDRIKISIYGLSSGDYLRNCRSEVDFDKLVSNVERLYRNRGNMTVQVKILDRLVGEDIVKGKEKFNSIFGEICDEIDIECLYPMFGDEIDYGGLFFQNMESPVNRHNSAGKRAVCPMPFFKLVIAADGRVDYCFSRGIIAGHLSDTSLFDIWNGKRRQEVLLSLLKCKHENITEPCSSCGCFQDTIAEEDNLDYYADVLYDRILTNQKDRI